MLDINRVRQDPEGIKKNLLRRPNPEYGAMLDQLLKLDADWRRQKQELDELRCKKNSISQEINSARKAGKDIKPFVKQAQELPEQVKKTEAQVVQLEKDMHELLLRIPNLLDSSVPDGKVDESKVIKVFGKPAKPKFELKSHVDLAVEKGWVDMDRAAKISGARWYFLKGQLAILEMALSRYGVDFMTKKGHEVVVPPFMMSRAAYDGVVDLGAFDEALYKMENEDLYGIATSEHPLTAQYMNEVFAADQLPLKLAGYSTNFRREAGAHGKDQKGIFRVHQFNKVEQIMICKPEDSWKHHEQLVKNAIDFWKTLKMPFRQVCLSTGDTGFVSAKTYDYEVWYPVQQAWREVGSCSNCLDYQARRLNMRFQQGEERMFVHTLNATLIPTSRAIVAILENFQQKDGTVKIPSVLHKYTGFKKLGK